MSVNSQSIITKSLLEQIFGKNVIEFSCKEGTKPGDNYLSKITAVRILLREDSNIDGKELLTLEKHIIVKCYPENEGQREFLDSVSIFTTEYLVYHELLPALSKLAEEADLRKCENSEHFGLNTAHFYGGNIVGDNPLTTFPQIAGLNENFIILEDVRKRGSGFQMLDRKKMLDLDKCLLVIDQLVHLHALSWVYKRRNKVDKLVDKHPHLKDAFYRIENEPGWRPVVEGMGRNALKVIQDEFGESSDIFQRFKDLLAKDVLAIVRMYLSYKGVNQEEAGKLLRVNLDSAGADLEPQEPWLVATHGDCWIPNFLWSLHPNSNQDQDKPSQVIPVDFQAIREACLTTDLTFFLYSSTSPSLRKECTDSILQFYFNKFIEICQKLNEKPPLGFTLPNLKRKYRRARIFALLMSIQFHSFVYKPDENSNKDMEEKNAGDGGNDIGEAYSDVVRGTDGNALFRQAIINTVKLEYDDGIL